VAQPNIAQGYTTSLDGYPNCRIPMQAQEDTDMGLCRTAKDQCGALDNTGGGCVHSPLRIVYKEGGFRLKSPL